MASCKDVTFEEKKFTRDDIKPGYVVLLRNGEYRMAMPVGCQGVLILTNGCGDNCKWNYLSNWSDYELLGRLTHFSMVTGYLSKFDTCVKQAEQFDIMKVFGHIRGTENYNASGCISDKNRPLLWERVEKKVKKMTVAEIEKELGYSVEIVAEK